MAFGTKYSPGFFTLHLSVRFPALLLFVTSGYLGPRCELQLCSFASAFDPCYQSSTTYRCRITFPLGRIRNFLETVWAFKIKLTLIIGTKQRISEGSQLLFCNLTAVNFNCISFVIGLRGHLQHLYVWARRFWGKQLDKSSTIGFEEVWKGLVIKLCFIANVFF